MKHKLRRSGFTLVEVLFAIFVISMCALIVACTMPVATMSKVRGDYLTRASDIAEKEIEGIRGAGFANAAPNGLLTAGLIDSSTPIATNTYSFTNVDNAVYDSPAKVLPQGTGTVQITNLSLGETQIVVTVTYVFNGQTKNVTTGTVVTKL